MIEEVLPHPPILELFGLVNGAFDPPTFRKACERFAIFMDDLVFDDIWRFSLEAEGVLIVSMETEPTGKIKPNGCPETRQLAVLQAISSICWWSTYSKSDHSRESSWRAEREQFDEYYFRSLARTVEMIGPPQLEGVDADEHRHHHAIWRGKTGLLILQQSAYDPQFGYDVNYWIRPWSGPDPRPTSPLIDWLCRQCESPMG